MFRLNFIIGIALALSIPLSALAERHGYISSQRCPHSCSSLGIPKRDCRDWREGDICYVEDLTRNPAPAQNLYPTLAPLLPTPTPHSHHHHDDESDPNARSACLKLDRYSLAAPRVDISRAKRSGNFFEGKYKIRGSVEGRCLVEAGLFEEGRLVESIPIVTTPEFRRFEFEVRARAERRPEIRVYNVIGERDEVELDSDTLGAGDTHSGGAGSGIILPW